MFELILWVCLWPVCYSITDFFLTKVDVLKGRKNPYDEDEEGKSAAVFFVIWVVGTIFILTQLNKH